MKSFTPATRSGNTRVFFSLLISFLMLVTPVMPAASAAARRVDHAKPKLSSKDIRPIDSTVAQPGWSFSPPTAIVSATKTDSFPDPNSDGKAEPGDTITYDVNVSNSGAADATGVTFTDTIDSNTTLVGGSLKVSPLAFADSYNATINTALNIGAPGVLANDTGTPAPTAQPIAAGATTAGGTVTLNADGSFNYTPPTGFTGADTFTYTATNGLTPDDTATVTIHVDEGPSVTTTSPVNGATNVAQNTNITVNFSEPVNATTSSFSVQCPTGSPQAFTLSASPAASFTLDPVADLPAGVTCTVTVFANQITDADTFDPPDQLAADYTFSFGVKPLAVDDMHSATGNVRINTTGSGFSVLSNDQGPGVSITAFDATSVHGGEVTMNTSTGTFTYNPPRGFTGTDSFNYTISNSAGSDQGTVVLTVSDMIWFINNAPGACSSGCDGRLTHPFTSLASFEAINGNGTTNLGAVIDPEAGDNIFIYTGSGNYTGPLTLENNQSVIGQGSSSSIQTLTGITLAADSDALPSTGGTNPTITNPSGGGITVAQNDDLHGLTISNTSGTALSGSSFGTLTVSENVIISNTGAAGTAVNLSTGVLAASFKSISAGNTVGPISPVNGIVLNNTTGSFTVTGDGTLARNGSGGTIASTLDDAVALTNATNVTLQSMNLINNGDTAPVSLTDAESTTGDQTVQINGGSNIVLSGVLIQNPTGSGYVALNLGGTNSIDNNSLITTLAAGQRHGIFVNNVNTNMTLFQIKNSRLTNFSSAASAVFFANAGTSNMALDVKGSTFDDLGVQALTVAAGGLAATTGTLTSTIGGPLAADRNFFQNAKGTGENNVGVLVNNGATHNSTVENNLFDNIARDGSVANTSVIRTQNNGGKMSATVKNNTVQNIAYASAGRHIIGHVFEPLVYNSSDFTNLTVDGNTVSNVTYTGTNREFMFVDYRTLASNGNVTIKNNNFNMPSAGNQQMFELRFRQSNPSTVNLLVDNNGNGTGAIGNVTASTVFLDIDSEAAATVNTTITNNKFTNTNGTPGQTMNVASEAATSSLCANITGNTFSPNTIGLDELAGNMTITQASSAALSTANGGATVVINGTPTFGQPACMLPTARLEPFEPSLIQRDDLARNESDADSLFARFMLTKDFASTLNNQSAQAATPTNVSGLSESKVDRSEMVLAHARLTRKASEVSAAHAVAKPRAINAAPAAPSGETVNATVGTLPAGKSVHIQFQVTVNSPLPGTVTQVSNQGTISGDNFASVLTDDPAAGGSADPTVTPILTPPDISIKDASVGEPASGSTPAAFAVVLTHAFSQPVTVNFSTANDTGGANPATAGSDYTTTSGTVTFNPGETIQTISVPVLADGDNSETAETFLVNLSGAVGGTIVDSQAVGTITPNATPGTVVISELRLSGPAGPDDEFVELLNNTDADIVVAASDSSTGWALVKSGGGCSDTPVVVAVIPNGTVIPARGNYLLVGSAYSLAAYAAGDQTLSTGIEDDRNVALFNTADIGNLQTGTRLDAVGFGTNTGNNCDLLREGGTLQPAAGNTSEYSFVRKVDKGETKDTGDNSADFVVVSTTPGSPVGSNTSPTLGAPGPENSSSPRGPVPCDNPTGTNKFDRAPLDSSQGFGSAPNLVRDTTADAPNNSTHGTIDFRRRFTNNTGGAVTRLRYRIVDMTTSPASPSSADLRARTSAPVTVTGVNDAATCGGSTPCSVVVQGTTLETPPAQALGGGVNSTLAAGTVTLGTPLANGASINLRFLFGVEQEGNYHVGIVIETLTAGSIGKDIWELRGNTQTGGDTDGDCNTPPVANAGADQTIECGGATTGVTLDGSASFDPDGDTPLSYEWREGVTVLGTTVVLNTSLAFGPHTITLKVTDPSGAFSEDTVNVNIVDTTDPMVTAPPNVTVYTGPGATSCGAVVSDATLGTATASDGCAGPLTPTRSGVPAGNNFPVGQTFVTYTANDGHGHTKSATQTVTVIDNTPPTLNVPPNQTVNAPANSCSANVDPGMATANDNCPGVTVTGTRSDSQPLNAPYPVGTTTITWKATDAANNMTTGTQTITVKDATPPVITLTTGVLTLSPPNHSYHTFNIAALVASVTDQCDASVDINDVVISQVTSDEPEDANGNGDGNTLNDIVIAPDCKSVQLRAERSGTSDGRVYKITLKVKDSSGNVATAVRQVTVLNSGAAIDSGVQYTVNGCTP